MSSSADTVRTGRRQKMASNTLWHVSKFRSTRALWMWHELEVLYPDQMPSLNLLSLDVDTLRKNKPEALLRANRQGKVPTFQSDDGLVLFESAAICNYFCRRFDIEEKLLRRDAQSMARHDVISHYVCGTGKLFKYNVLIRRCNLLVANRSIYCTPSTGVSQPTMFWPHRLQFNKS